MMCVWGNGSMGIIQGGNAVARFMTPFSLYSFRSPVIETLLLKTRRREQVENNDCFLSVTHHIGVDAGTTHMLAQTHRNQYQAFLCL